MIAKIMYGSSSNFVSALSRHADRVKRDRSGKRAITPAITADFNPKGNDSLVGRNLYFDRSGAPILDD